MDPNRVDSDPYVDATRREFREAMLDWLAEHMQMDRDTLKRMLYNPEQREALKGLIEYSTEAGDRAKLWSKINAEVFRVARQGGKAWRAVVRGGRLARRIPFAGIFFILLFLPSDLQAKGIAGGLANAFYDAIPVVGTIKGVVEVGTGDIIPDLENEDDDPCTLRTRTRVRRGPWIGDGRTRLKWKGSPPEGQGTGTGGSGNQGGASDKGGQGSGGTPSGDSTRPPRRLPPGGFRDPVTGLPER